MNFFSKILSKVSKFKNSNKYISKTIDFLKSRTFNRIVSVIVGVIMLGIAIGSTAGTFAVALAGAGIGATIVASGIGLSLQFRTERNLEKLQKTNKLLKYIENIDEKILKKDAGSKKQNFLIKEPQTTGKQNKILKSIKNNIKDNFAEDSVSLAISVLNMSVLGIIASGFSIIFDAVSGTKNKLNIENQKQQIKSANFNKNIDNLEIKDLEKIAHSKYKLCSNLGIDIDQPPNNKRNAYTIIKDLLNPFYKHYELKNFFEDSKVSDIKSLNKSSSLQNSNELEIIKKKLVSNGVKIASHRNNLPALHTNHNKSELHH